MSISKHLHEDRIMAGGWRKVVKRPTAGMWDGSDAWAFCSTCRWSIEYHAAEKIPPACPRCGGWLVERPDAP